MSFIDKQLRKKLAKRLDDIVKLKGTSEMVDGLVFRIIISIVDDHASDKIPEQYKPLILTMLNAFAEGNQGVLNDDLSNELNALIDIPLLNEDNEGILISGALSILKGLIFKNK